MSAIASPREGGRGWRRALTQLAATLLFAIGAAHAIPAAWMPAKAALAQVLLERSFERGRASGVPDKPWPWADVTAMGRLSVARLGASDIVLAGASGEAMAFGPAEFPTMLGNRVTLLAAHRDTHFAWMRDLKAGDELTLERIDGSEARYRVMALETVRWDEFAVSTQPHRKTLLLATCYPFDAAAFGPLRRVARAVRED